MSIRFAAAIALAILLIATLAVLAWPVIVRPFLVEVEKVLPAPPPDDIAIAATAAPSDGCDILYYRNPMGLPDVSDEPKKDSMGMDYIPVCAEEAGAGFVISPDRQQILGVTLVTAERRDLTRWIEATARIEINQRSLSVIAPRVALWIDELFVDAVGDRVGRGAPLARVYAPDLIEAQLNYLAIRSNSAAAANAEERLRRLGLSEAEIEKLKQSGEVLQTVTLLAPQDGTVMRKAGIAGMYIAEGETLMEIADLGTVWAIAELYERDLGLLKSGGAVEVSVDAYPGRIFGGEIEIIMPEIMTDTRTAQVRIVLANDELLLRPGMFALARFAVALDGEYPVVPRSAILDSGTRQVALVALGEGRFEARTVKLGLVAAEFVQVTEGLAIGEEIVESAAFLIDAESNIRAALQAFAPIGQPTDTPSQP